MQSDLNKFLSKIAEEESGKSSVTIGNLREVARIINKHLNGKLYDLIRKKPYLYEGKDQIFKNK